MDCACLECHTTAFDPVEGTYAYGGVTCEACHGPYLEDHPYSGTMDLFADSSLCQSCHVDTHQQWLISSHAQANVQCISCHQVHSQDLRLADQSLCESCHAGQQQNPVHAAHVGRGADCVDCHLSSDYELQASLEVEDLAAMAMAERPTVASHEFSVSSAEACIGCHIQGAGLHQAISNAATTEQASALAVELDQIEEENRSLQSLSLITLGVGLGVGVLLGAIFFLAVGFVCQRRGWQ
jgi:hypothetical protein